MPTISKDRIAERAYALWQAEGRPYGRDLAHWLLAEAQIGARIPIARAIPTSTLRPVRAIKKPKK